MILLWDEHQNHHDHERANNGINERATRLGHVADVR